MRETGPRAASACPICGKQEDALLHPFCSSRCADVDLGRWLTGQYRVPGPAPEESEGSADDMADDRSGCA